MAQANAKTSGRGVVDQGRRSPSRPSVRCRRSRDDTPIGLTVEREAPTDVRIEGCGGWANSRGYSVTDVNVRLRSGMRSEAVAVYSGSGSNANDPTCLGRTTVKWRRSTVATCVMPSRSAVAITAASVPPSLRSAYCLTRTAIRMRSSSRKSPSDSVWPGPNASRNVASAVAPRCWPIR
jgi:hypothetical protein